MSIDVDIDNLYIRLVDVEWDPAKNSANQKKHRIPFEIAFRVFEGPHLEFEDDRQAYEEPRFSVLGEVEGRLVFLTYTIRGAKRRIISARKATKNERKAFYTRVYG